MALKHMEMPHADGPSEHPSLQVAQGQSSITLGMAHRRRDTLKGAEVVVTANLTPPEMIRGPRDLSAYSVAWVWMRARYFSHHFFLGGRQELGAVL